MTATPCSSAESPRSEVRRTQILDAARGCFRRHGFHGASIAQICAEAGMSAGHIYHYFDSKEAIIAAIVEQDRDRLLTITAEMRAAHDVQRALEACTASGVRDNLDPDTAALKLEIIAEASRNPRVAEIVRGSDRQCRESMLETLRGTRRHFGHEDDAARLQSLDELIATLFDGLLVRAVRNPDVDREMVVRMFHEVILMLMRDGDR